jgi:hypothetical protein
MAGNVNEEQELSLFIVIVAPFPIESAGKVVDAVPPIDFTAPVNDTVLVPPERVPPLFVQFPPTLSPKLLPLVLSVTEVSVKSPVSVVVANKVFVPLPLSVRLL